MTISPVNNPIILIPLWMCSAIYRLIQYWQTVELDSFHKDLKIPLLNEFTQVEWQSFLSEIKKNFWDQIEPLNFFNIKSFCARDFMAWWMHLRRMCEKAPIGFQDQLLKIFCLIYFQARWLELSRMTGCVPRCSVRSFSFVEKTSSQADWGRNWWPSSSTTSKSLLLSSFSSSSLLSRSAAFYLDVKTSSYTFQNEFYACEFSSMTHQYHRLGHYQHHN